MLPIVSMNTQPGSGAANATSAAGAMGAPGPAVELRGLAKRYGGRTEALHGLTIAVPRGQVYGLLGPNGAGKTTALRLVLGLLRPSAGEARVLGAPPGTPAALRRIGAVMEVPAFYPHLSGADNLAVLAHYAGVPLGRIEPAMQQVGLLGWGRANVRTYSLGMRHRLALAGVLMKDPDLLILDEPTNGLDPVGIAWVRDLARALAAAGKTVLLSSHILAIAEQACDRVAILQAGSLVAEGSVKDLLGPGWLVVRATPMERALEVAAESAGRERISVLGDAFRVEVAPERAPEMNRRLVAAGVDVHALQPVRPTLEDVFLRVTGGARS